MILVRNTRILKIITFNSKWVIAIALFPFVIIRNELPAQIDEEMIIRHEAIHLRQQIELAVVLFYLWYAFDYLKNRIRGMNHFDAYSNIIFEKEARINMHRRDYLASRKIFAFLHYR